MTRDELHIVLIACAWAGGVGIAGLVIARFARRASLRWLPVGVAVVAVGAVVAGIVGTARAMFLSSHDYGVVLWVCAVAGVVSVALAVLAGSAVVRESDRLRAGARVFGESGRYDTEVAGPAEFASLSAQLREASDRLAESRRREEMLEESRRELVSWVSHDLRTPLAGMRAMAEALEDGLVDDPARYHHRIKTEIDRTVRLVDDLFELSQLHAGVMVPALERIPLGDLVSESLAGAESVAAAKGVRLEGRVDPGVVVDADPDAFARVIANLLMNAIRHTPADGSVQVVGSVGPDFVEVSVSDGCGGIPDDELARVFDVSFRGEAARTPAATPGGAGLGLAIVRGIVEAHRGRVEVANVSEGCRFRVRIPSTLGVATGG